jgi:hypothetical protein
MKAILNYWNPKNESVVTADGFRYLDNKSVITKVVTIEGTEEGIFKEFYEKNNSLRYCNGSHYEFQDADLKHRYDAWYKSLSKATTFNMYYGNGIVD